MGSRDAGRRRDRSVARTICDASPLIALDQIGRLDLLLDLFGPVLIPTAVDRETPRVVKPRWLITQPLERAIPERVVAAGLGPGETEAMALALAVGADRIILDERRATRMARSLGVAAVGTVGVLLLAKSQGLLPMVRPAMDALLDTGFHLGPKMIADALVRAGEEV